MTSALQKIGVDGRCLSVAAVASSTISIQQHSSPYSWSLHRDCHCSQSPRNQNLLLTPTVQSVPRVIALLLCIYLRFVSQMSGFVIKCNKSLMKQRFANKSSICQSGQLEVSGFVS